MLSKLITWADTREEAIKKMASALNEYIVLGVRTNIGFLIRMMQNDEFKKAKIDTGFIERHPELLNPEDLDYKPALIAATLAMNNAGSENIEKTHKTSTSNWKLSARRFGVSGNSLL